MCRHAMRSALTCLCVPFLFLPGCGREAASIELYDLAGDRVNPLETTDGGVTVFVFTRFDCPVSNRYAPEVRKIHEDYAPRGVTFYLVYLDPDQSADIIRKHMVDYGYTCAALRDPEHALADLTGARVTPEAAVFDDDGRMVYCGRIDDWYVKLGQARAAPTKRDLREALDAVLDGRPVEQLRTEAVGCIIADLRQ